MFGLVSAIKETEDPGRVKICKLIHILKVKKNGESLDIWSVEIFGSRTVAYGARISQLRLNAIIECRGFSLE